MSAIDWIVPAVLVTATFCSTMVTKAAQKGGAPAAQPRSSRITIVSKLSDIDVGKAASAKFKSGKLMTDFPESSEELLKVRMEYAEKGLENSAEFNGGNTLQITLPSYELLRNAVDTFARTFSGMGLEDAIQYARDEPRAVEGATAALNKLFSQLRRENPGTFFSFIQPYVEWKTQQDREHQQKCPPSPWTNPAWAMPFLSTVVLADGLQFAEWMAEEDEAMDSEAEDMTSGDFRDALAGLDEQARKLGILGGGAASDVALQVKATELGIQYIPGSDTSPCGRQVEAAVKSVLEAVLDRDGTEYVVEERPEYGQEDVKELAYAARVLALAITRHKQGTLPLYATKFGMDALMEAVNAAYSAAAFTWSWPMLPKTNKVGPTPIVGPY